MPRVITVLADGFEEIEAVTYIDILRRVGAEVVLLGLNDIEARGAHDIRVKADALFADFSGEFDAVVLPGGMPGTRNLNGSNELLKFVRDAHAGGKLCAAICAAPSVFAKAGILSGKKATCYPGCEGMLHDAKIVDAPVVRDKNIITGKAVGTAIPFALELVKALFGEDAAKVAAAAVQWK